MSDEAQESGPRFTVTRGNPTDEELAALVMVLSAAANRAAETTAPSTSTSGWASYWRRARTPLHPGPDAWQASARPHAPYAP